MGIYQPQLKLKHSRCQSLNVKAPIIQNEAKLDKEGIISDATLGSTTPRRALLSATRTL